MLATTQAGAIYGTPLYPYIAPFFISIFHFPQLKVKEVPTMKTIRDRLGRIVCKADPATGTVETKYCKQTVRFILGIGESMTVEREGIVTTIIRSSTTDFRIVT